MATSEDIYRLLGKVGHSCSSSEMNEDVIFRLKKWNPSWAKAGNKKSRKKEMKQTHHEGMGKEKIKRRGKSAA